MGPLVWPSPPNLSLETLLGLDKRMSVWDLFRWREYTRKRFARAHDDFEEMKSMGWAGYSELRVRFRQGHKPSFDSHGFARLLRSRSESSDGRITRRLRLATGLDLLNSHDHGVGPYQVLDASVESDILHPTLKSACVHSCPSFLFRCEPSSWSTPGVSLFVFPFQ